MSQTTAKLLESAAGILGGEEALARHLDIGPILMSAYLEARRPLPDYLLLRVVDVVLDQMKPPMAKPREPTVDAVLNALKSLPPST